MSYIYISDEKRAVKGIGWKMLDEGQDETQKRLALWTSWTLSSPLYLGGKETEQRQWFIGTDKARRIERYKGMVQRDLTVPGDLNRAKWPKRNPAKGDEVWRGYRRPRGSRRGELVVYTTAC